MNGKRKGAVERVFAGELNRSTVTLTGIDPPEQRVLTPTGAFLHRIFMVGVLTEVTRKGEEIHRARLSDPTGALDLVLPPHNLPPADLLCTVDLPAFLACTASVRLRGARIVLEPDMLSVVGRAERDAWILFTAEQTIRRIEALQQARAGGATSESITAVLSQYHPTDKDLHDLAAIVRSALETIPAEPAPPRDTESKIREILGTHTGTHEIAWVLEKAAEQGIGEEEARHCLQTFLAEGECYSPRNGHIRLL